MTDTEIIKALECCLINWSCAGCPMQNPPNMDCQRVTRGLALDLIKRQQAEIEHFREVTKMVKTEAIKEYEEKLHPYKLHYGNLRMEIAREVCDRLKERLQWDCEYESKLIFENDIDNLLKETENECEPH